MQRFYVDSTPVLVELNQYIYRLYFLSPFNEEYLVVMNEYFFLYMMIFGLKLLFPP